MVTIFYSSATGFQYSHKGSIVSLQCPPLYCCSFYVQVDFPSGSLVRMKTAPLCDSIVKLADGWRYSTVL